MKVDWGTGLDVMRDLYYLLHKLGLKTHFTIMDVSTFYISRRMRTLRRDGW